MGDVSRTTSLALIAIIVLTNLVALGQLVHDLVSVHVEAATLHWVDWFNRHRLLEVNGDLPPIELEHAHDRHTTGLDQTG